MVFRLGRLRHEFLLQRGFMKKEFYDGAMSTCMRLSEPLGLGRGRGGLGNCLGGLRLGGDPKSIGCSRDYDILLCLRWLSLHPVEQTPHSKAPVVLLQDARLRPWTSA